MCVIREEINDGFIQNVKIRYVYKGIHNMNPQTRMMKRLEIEDALEADRIFNILMGDKVAPRREFIETHSANLDMATLDI